MTIINFIPHFAAAAHSSRGPHHHHITFMALSSDILLLYFIYDKTSGCKFAMKCRLPSLYSNDVQCLHDEAWKRDTSRLPP